MLLNLCWPYVDKIRLEEAIGVNKEALDIGEVDLFEINEAFSGSTVAVLKELQLDPVKVNVNGGSVAMGHPIGASGCRVLVTLLHEMIRQEKTTGLASLCLGGGEAGRPPGGARPSSAHGQD